MPVARISLILSRQEVRKIIKKGCFSDLENQKMNKTEKQYQAHEVLSNKNSLIEMNRQFLKI